MPSINDVIEELQFLSDRISTQVRTIAIGLLAITWAILVGDSSFLRKLSEGLGKSLLLIALLCIFVLLLDFLQYVTSYIYVDKVRRSAEDGKTKAQTNEDGSEIEYPESVLRMLRECFFWVKQGFLVLTLVFFLVIVARYMYSQLFFAH